ncbi:ParA family protein [Rhodococcus sp. NPDC056960]|uniref:ParA family protein n=1 Tax=Rhodococcus sp. NPDC056960 TaxID=3345982 RepID=UPI00362687BB
MANIIVCHSRKGGVGKTTEAYELAYELDAVLVDLEHDGGGATRKWGYRPQDRVKVPLLDAIRSGRVPKPMKGFKKPLLVPGHPDLYDQAPSEEVMAEALVRWAEEWDTEWVVVDTHPGSSPHGHGALSVANVVLAPTPLRTLDLDATEQLIDELADYPLVISPSMVPPVPPARAVERLTRMIEGTPVQVGPPIPAASHVGTRTKRIAITAEEPPAKPLRAFAAAITDTAKYLREYVQ